MVGAFRANEEQRALVVYESMFGNTKQVADAIAEGLREAMPVDLLEVSDAPDVLNPSTALLVVGAPTHAFSLSRESTRKSAREQASSPLVSQGRGVREWLAVPGRSDNVMAATFDTRVKVPRFPGPAAKKAQKALKGIGFRIVAKANTFDVGGTQGPLLDGELERAKRWGVELAGELTGAVNRPRHHQIGR